MSVELRIMMPIQVAEALKKKAEREKATIEEVVLRAIVKILEEEST